MRYGLLFACLLVPMVATADPPCDPPALRGMTFPAGMSEEDKANQRAMIVDRLAELAHAQPPPEREGKRAEYARGLGGEAHMRACEERACLRLPPGQRGRCRGKGHRE